MFEGSYMDVYETMSWMTEDMFHLSQKKKFRESLFYQAHYYAKQVIIQQFPVDSIIELGVARGLSALTFLKQCPTASYVGFDNCIDCHDDLSWAKELLKEFDARLIKADTQKMDELPFAADMVHVDGLHTTEGCYHDLVLANKAAKKYIVVDDAHDPPVWEACRRFQIDHRGWLPAYLDSNAGDILFFKNGD